MKLSQKQADEMETLTATDFSDALKGTETNEYVEKNELSVLVSSIRSRFHEDFLAFYKI